jgi:hypothetical protein
MYISPQQNIERTIETKLLKGRKERAISLRGTLIQPECFKITYIPEGINPFVSIPKK